MKAASLILLVLWLCPVLSDAGQAAVNVGSSDPSVAEMASQVRELGLGSGAFVVGNHLTDDQLKQSAGHRLGDAYPGTIKFSSGDVVVVADETTHLILAIYERREEVHDGDLQQMVGQLMARFGEPTTMAHEKIIYWAYGPSGKIDDRTYNAAKATGQIDILATVKFHSTMALDPGAGDSEETGTIYYIITSDRLLGRFVSTP